MEPVGQTRSPAIGNYLVAAMFACIGVVEVIGGEYLDAGLWLSLTLAFTSLGNESRDWRTIPRPRKIAGYLFLAAAVALFAARIATDLSS